MNAIGLIELPHMADAVVALDVMLKTANVSFLTWEKKLGGRLVTIIVTGDVAAVTESVGAAINLAGVRVVDSAVIANPHKETMRLIEISREKNKF